MTETTPTAPQKKPTETLLGQIIYDAMWQLQISFRDPDKGVAAAEYIAAAVVSALEGEPQ